MTFDGTTMREALSEVDQRSEYRLSFRNIDGVMTERGVFVDYSTLRR